MNFKLDTLVLGIIEIFAVLLPGALITYFLYGKVGDKLFGFTAQPDVLIELQQAEAKQKFFRSLSVVFLLIAIIHLYLVGFEKDWLIAGALLLLANFSVKLYAKLRFKNTELAYQALIALEYYKPEDKHGKK